MKKRSENSEFFWVAIVCLTAAACMLFLLLAINTSYASPFLVSDPHPDATVDRYEIEVNGTREVAAWEYVGAETRIKHDWAGYADGAYTVRARAGNVWGWSSWSDPFSFAKARPDPRVFGLGIEE